MIDLLNNIRCLSIIMYLTNKKVFIYHEFQSTIITLIIFGVLNNYIDTWMVF